MNAVAQILKIRPLNVLISGNYAKQNKKISRYFIFNLWIMKTTFMQISWVTPCLKMIWTFPDTCIWINMGNNINNQL